MTILVTGATGFVGAALCEKFFREGVSFRVASKLLHKVLVKFDVVEVGDISSTTLWSDALRNVQQVVHLAARVHIMDEQGLNAAFEFNRVNVEGTCNLARQAAKAGVRRFVYLSSIKVNGEKTKNGLPFSILDTPAPIDPYSISKYEAEQCLRKVSSQTGMEVVIIRSPLVYGPGVKANFKSLMQWLSADLPLPFASITKNRRSLVALENLVDLINTCLNHQNAANQTFLVSDGEVVSTVELLRRMGAALGHPARLFYVPTPLIKLVTYAVNKQNIYMRLCESLEIDITYTQQLLNWKPPISMEKGLQLAAEGLRV